MFPLDTCQKERTSNLMKNELVILLISLFLISCGDDEGQYGKALPGAWTTAAPVTSADFVESVGWE